MVMEEYKKQFPEYAYSLLASDISIRALQTAYQGIYDIEKTDPVPLDLKREYLLRSKSDPKIIRIKPRYRSKISFKRINFMDNQLGVNKDYDIIFCRNVLIYFNKNTQEQVIHKFCNHLKPGGLLFLGHSESIIGMNVPLKQISPTVFRFEG
jgi:chemotaxis protein methyltransferase CheR